MDARTEDFYELASLMNWKVLNVMGSLYYAAGSSIPFSGFPKKSAPLKSHLYFIGELLSQKKYWRVEFTVGPKKETTIRLWRRKNLEISTTAADLSHACILALIEEAESCLDPGYS